MSYRDEFPSCPACPGKLEVDGARLRCGACKGVLVPVAQVEQMLHDMAPDDLRTLDARITARFADAPRSCPRCGTPLRPMELETISVDRCDQHGLWFDTDHLAWMLEVAGRDHAARNASARPQLDEVSWAPSRGGLPSPPARPLWKRMWERFWGRG